MAIPGPPALLGRARELALLDRLVEDARNGRSSVLVVRGEPGVGKTALLNHVTATASDLRIAQISGAESEMELAFAGVHQLCAPMLDRLDSLPAPQREAISTAFGLREGRPPDRFLVGLAALTLLAESAAKLPLVCVVDDVQWLDSASVQTLSLVARRLDADPIAMIFAVRESEDKRELEGLDGFPELVLTGLDDRHSRQLLETAMPGRMDDRVRERILAEARGNPLALLELPRDRPPAALAGGYSLVGGDRPLIGRVERSFAAQLQTLPSDTRLLLLVAAADPVGEAALLWRAATRLGLGVEVAEPAETAELISIGARVRFRHALVRSAVYHSASLRDRRRVHGALADAIDPRVDSEHRAWHRAQAAAGPSEEIAAELERSADRAQARGGVAAAAAFLAHATDLTPDPEDRARRALAAAQAKLDAGAPGAALALLAVAEAAQTDELQRARIDLLRSQIAFARHRGGDAPALLLDAARRLRDLDPELSRETYVEALMSSVFAGRFVWSEEDGPEGVARAARAAPPAPDPPRAVDLLLDALVKRFTAGYVAAAPQLLEAAREFRREDDEGVAAPRWYGIVGRIALELWDKDSWDELAAKKVEILRSEGALTLLPVALVYRAGVGVQAGRFDEADALLQEATAISNAVGALPPLDVQPVLAAHRGEEERTLRLVREIRRRATVRGEGRVIPVIQYALSVLHNGLGQWRDALAATGLALEHDDLGLYGYMLFERVEAAVRSGEPELAAESLRVLVTRAEASGTELALGVAARSRALLASGAEADTLYRAALAHLDRRRTDPMFARAQLVYGEWLRGEGRLSEAVEQLKHAHASFTRVGAAAFAERARRELVAAGEPVRAPAAAVSDTLTGQESYIARLAADGHTNQEIAAQLFLSPRTVEWHLGKIFAKLGITSRRGLPAALLARGANQPSEL
ncbi:AAA family ATPase [Amycolatopsis sp. NPDC051903]|uniref:helix-turn-helix transcriptional regulator n=1 Tax=Amycolatopsis sp. NPDC051903 TaxID=3363936 RepID=UPI0037B9791F